MSQKIGKTPQDNEIFYGVEVTPYGDCLLAKSAKGICFLGFIQKDKTKVLIEMKKVNPKAIWILNQKFIQPVISAIFQKFDDRNQIQLDLNGTKFQQEVWESLKTIPTGKTFCYEEVAMAIKKPKAVRAVASAIAKNPVSYIIPCHRVISKSGKIHLYRWGVDIKKAILKSESAFYE